MNIYSAIIARFSHFLCLCTVLFTSYSTFAQGTGRTLEFPSEVGSLAFSPNGELLAAVRSPGGRGPLAVRVWNTRLGQKQFDIATHRHTVQGAAFSASGRLLAIATSDLSGVEVLIAEVSSGRVLGHYDEQSQSNPRVPNFIIEVAISPDDSTLTVNQEAGESKYEIRLLDIRDPSHISRKGEAIFASSAQARSLTYGNNTDMLGFVTTLGSSQAKGHVRLIESSSGKEHLDEKPFTDGEALAFSSDDSFVVATGVIVNKDSGRTAIRVYNVRSGAEVGEFDRYHLCSTTPAFTADGKLLFLATEKGGSAECNLFSADIATNRVSKLIPRKVHASGPFAASRTGRLFAVVDEAQQIHLEQY